MSEAGAGPEIPELEPQGVIPTEGVIVPITEVKADSKVIPLTTEKLSERELWLSKQIRKPSFWAVLAGSVGVLAFIKWLGWGKGGKGIYEGSGWFVKPTSPADLSPEEQTEYSRDQQLEAYAMRGIGTQMGYREIKGVNDPDFLNPKAEMMINFAGKYGASFMFATYDKDEKGKGKINPDLVEEMHLNTGYSADYLNNIWVEASHGDKKESRDFALKVLQDSPNKINPNVIGFFQEANRLIDADQQTPETSQDRVESLFKWFRENIEPTLSAKEMRSLSQENFNEAVSAACTVTGIDFASIRGAMETAAISGGEPVEVVETYAYLPTTHDSLAGQMEMSASAYILIPLVLLRLGHESVRSLGKDISSWIDKAEYREMFTALKRFGQRFFSMKK